MTDAGIRAIERSPQVGRDDPRLGVGLFWMLAADGRTPVMGRDELAALRWYATSPDRVVGQHLINAPGLDVATARQGDGSACVSTVFLLTDPLHAAGLHTLPVLWETMVFAPTLPDLDHWQHRYVTWADALRGHLRTLTVVGRAWERQHGQAARTYRIPWTPPPLAVG